MGGTRYRCVSERVIWGVHVLSRGDSIRFMDEDMHHTNLSCAWHKPGVTWVQGPSFGLSQAFVMVCPMLYEKRPFPLHCKFCRAEPCSFDFFIHSIGPFWRLLENTFSNPSHKYLLSSYCAACLILGTRDGDRGGCHPLGNQGRKGGSVN